MKHKYGMRLRGFAPMCQPMDGLVSWKDTDKRETGFWSVLIYSRRLSDAEVLAYDLEYLGAED